MKKKLGVKHFCIDVGVLNNVEDVLNADSVDFISLNRRINAKQYIENLIFWNIIKLCISYGNVCYLWSSDVRK